MFIEKSNMKAAERSTLIRSAATTLKTQRENEHINTTNQYAECDIDGHFIYWNSWTQKLYNLPDSYNVEGRSYQEIPHPVLERFSERFRLYDREIINSPSPKKVLEVHEFSIGWKAYQQYWTSIKNESGEVVGIKGVGVLIDDYWVSRINAVREKMKLESIDKTKGCSLKLENIPLLNNRQSEIIILLMMDLKSKAISNALGISKNTTDGYIRELKDKFDAVNLQNLIDKAFYNEYQNHLIPSFCKSDISFLIS